MFTRVYILHRLNPLLGTELSFFIAGTSFLLAGSFFLTKAFRNDHVAACSTALRSTTHKNELGGYVNVPCSSEMTQRSRKADWPKFL